VARVVRRTGRDGRVTTKEARLERHHPDGGVEVVAGAARELLPAVEHLLGLTFTHFTRCVVLPQGEFARFLHDKPADRQALLEGLLGLGLYDVLVKLANQRAAEARAVADVAERSLAELPPADDGALAAARTHREVVGALVVDVDAAQGRLEQLRSAAATATAAAVADDALAAALGRVAVPSVVAELGGRLVEGRAAVDAAAAAHGAAVARLEAARAQLASHPPLDALEAAAQAHLRIAKGNGVRAEWVAASDEAERYRREADAAAATAEEAQETARTALDSVRRLHAAQDLASHLVVGEACPVCRHVVATVPRRVRTPTLKAAEEGLTDAERVLRAARAVAGKATEAAHRAAAELARADATLAALHDQVAAFPDAEALVAQLAAVAALAAELAAARDDAAVTDEAAAVARQAVAQFEAGLERAADDFHAQRDAVAGGGPPPPGAELVAAWEDLAEWARAEGPAVAARAGARRAEADSAAATLDAIVAGLSGRASAVGISVGEADLAQAVARADERAEQAMRTIEAARDTAARLGAETAAARRRYDVAHELGRHLAASGFPRWLVAEALDLLVADASVLLRRLSAGQYSLVAMRDGSDLGVIDHANADEVRPVRSLSGGETFQASLAFALALSDHLAALASTGAARLDAIFLDEGFGTLDADSLDTVAATIEALAGGGRMVGIVTHVRELAERVPVRYVVRKGPRTATVDRVVA
jgi:exonuclease SbcC